MEYLLNQTACSIETLNAGQTLLNSFITSLTPLATTTNEQATYIKQQLPSLNAYLAKLKTSTATYQQLITDMQTTRVNSNLQQRKVDLST